MMNANTDFENLRALYQPRIPNDWRNRLPDPAGYYPSRLSKLGRPNGEGWAACRCPFHDDTHASAAVNLKTGAFRCFACDEKGDLPRFHQRITGLGFKAAVCDLLEVRA